jgi:hypothetical protein
MSFGLIPKDSAYSVLNSTRTVSNKATSEQLTNAGPLVFENLPTTPGDSQLSINSATGIVSRTLFPPNPPATGTTWGQYLYYSPNDDKFVTGGANISLGNNAGQLTQGTYAVAIGTSAGQDGQGTNSVAIGNLAGQISQGESAVALGALCGTTSQSSNAIAIGLSAGAQLQGNSAVAIGQLAGEASQSGEGISIGFRAGQVSQGGSSVAIGFDSGRTNQGTNSVAIGSLSGEVSQASDSVSIGYYAGQNSQGSEAVCLGVNSGQNNQGYRGIAIGSQAGIDSQGAESIAIGTLAGPNSQAANTIILNASGVGLNSIAPSSFYVSPVRAVAGGVALLWNAATGEVSIAPSQRETKNTIIDIADDTSVVFGLQARNFIYNTDENKEVQVGYIAEEVEELNPKLAIHNVVGGPPVNINYNAVLVFLVEEVRKLKAQVDSLINLPS